MPSARQKADETHRRILQAALDCFTRHGYHATTMDDIAAKSGTSKGTLYWHFSSKDDLFESAIRWFFDTSFGPEVLVALERSPSAADKLRMLTDSTVDLIGEAQPIFHLFLEFWASSPDRATSAGTWLDLLDDYQDIIISIMHEGVERGEFSPVDAEALAWALTAAYDGLAAYVMLNPDLDLERIHTALMETFLEGIAQPSSATQGADP